MANEGVRCPSGHWNVRGAARCYFCNLEIVDTKVPEGFKVPLTFEDRQRLVKGEIMKDEDKKREKGPKVHSPAFLQVCPGCLEETLEYDEEKRLFVCLNPLCERRLWALTEWKEP